MTHSDDTWEKPPNYEALMLEYEMKVQYMLMMSNRLYQLISAHLIFTGACLAAYNSVPDKFRWAFAFMNVAACALVIFWIDQAQRRSKKRGDRVKAIGKLLLIEDYKEERAEKGAPNFRLNSISLWGIIWLVAVALFWIGLFVFGGK